MNVLGATQTVLVCVPGEGASSVCPAGSVPSVTSAYLIAPTSSNYFDSLAQPFDSATAGAYFGFAFASTLFVYLLAMGCGALIQMVKDA